MVGVEKAPLLMVMHLTVSSYVNDNVPTDYKPALHSVEHELRNMLFYLMFIRKQLLQAPVFGV
jgi:hypothetical protein